MNRIVTRNGRKISTHSFSHDEFLKTSGVDISEYAMFINSSVPGMSVNRVPYEEPEERFPVSHSKGFKGYASSVTESRKRFGDYEVVVEFHPKGEQGWVKRDGFVVRYYKHRQDGFFDVMGFQAYAKDNPARIFGGRCR